MTTALMPAGSSEREFRRLAALETDDCVIWPYAKTGPRQYGQVYIAGRKTTAHREALALRTPQPIGYLTYALHGPCNRPACMNYRHLYWGTPRQNNLDQRRDGTAQLGELNHYSKLTWVQVHEIRATFEARQRTQRQLAVDFGVTVMTINRAIRHESWSSAA